MATTAALDEKKKQFLQNPYVGVVTTLREDGSWAPRYSVTGAPQGSVRWATPSIS